MKIIILITFILFIIVISCQKIDYSPDKKEKCIQLENKIKSSILNLSIIEKINLGKQFAEECILTTESSKKMINDIKEKQRKDKEKKDKEIKNMIERINNGECIHCKNDFGEDECMKHLIGQVYCPRKEFSECVTNYDCGKNKITKVGGHAYYGVCENGKCKQVDHTTTSGALAN